MRQKISNNYRSISSVFLIKKGPGFTQRRTSQKKPPPVTREVLNTLMRSLERFPAKKSVSLERRCRSFVEKLGGHEVVFQSILDEDVKKLPWVRFKGEPKALMKDLLSQGPLNLEEKKMLLELRLKFDFNGLLNDWIRAIQRVPAFSAPKDSLEFRLFVRVQTRGGPKVIYQEILDPDVKTFLWVRFKAQPHPLLEELRGKETLTKEEQEVLIELRLSIDFESFLNDWIRINRFLPETTAPLGTLERRLYTRINHRDGYKSVSKTILDEDVKQYPWVRFKVEPEILYEELKTKGPLTLEEKKVLVELFLKFNPEVLLNHWMRAMKRFPKNNASNGTLEKRLSTWIANHGKRKGVYENVLEEDIKALVPAP